MTDLEFINYYIDQDNGFVNRLRLSELSRRGLVHIIDYLTGTKEERKAVAYARLAKAGKVFGDDDMDYISGKVKLMEDLRRGLSQIEITNAVEVEKLLDYMSKVNTEIKNYFKK